VSTPLSDPVKDPVKDPVRSSAATACRAGLALLLMLCACVVPARDNAPATGDAAAVEPLLVASDLDNMPFAGVDAAGNPIGRDVDMMNAVAEALGRPIEWHRADFETLLPAAQSGLVDMVCATLGVTAERAKKVSFSRPYFETVIAVVVRAGEGEPRGWDDLDDKLVAAGEGTTSERAVRAKLPRAILAPESKDALGAAERLLLGEVDGIAMDGPAADALVADSGAALTTLHTPLAPERYALALPQDREKLLTAVNEALRGFEASGQMRRWNGKWGLRPTKLPGN